MHPDLIGSRIRSGDSKVNSGLHLSAHLTLDRMQSGFVRKLFEDQPIPVQLDGIARRLPLLLFLLAAVVVPADIADVVTDPG